MKTHASPPRSPDHMALLSAIDALIDQLEQTALRAKVQDDRSGLVELTLALRQARQIRRKVVNTQADSSIDWTALVGDTLAVIRVLREVADKLYDLLFYRHRFCKGHDASWHDYQVVEAIRGVVAA